MLCKPLPRTYVQNVDNLFYVNQNVDNFSLHNIENFVDNFVDNLLEQIVNIHTINIVWITHNVDNFI